MIGSYNGLCSLVVGKVCNMDAQQYVDEEEGIDTGTEKHTEQNWGRRNTQVAPEGTGG